MTNEEKMETSDVEDAQKLSRQERRKMYGDIISSYVAVLAAAVSIISAAFTLYYTKKEYEYKRKPELEISMEPALHREGTREFNIFPKRLIVEIEERNKLDDIYLIYADNTVELLNIEKDMVEVKLQKSLESLKGRADLETENFNYSYQFILLDNIDGSYSLYLYYLKTSKETDPMQVVNECVSDIELFGLKYGHEGDSDYDGERIMAEQYERIINYLEGNAAQ